MAIYNQNITLDLNTNTSYVVVGAKQGDHNSRTITATILNNGELFDIPQNATASYRIRKSNGHGSWNNADIYPSEHKVVINLTSNDLSTSGRSYADILIQVSASRIGTVSFIIDVQAAPNIAQEAIQSDAFGYLYSVVDSVYNVVEDAQAWAEGKRSTEDVLGDSYVIHTNSSLTISLNFDTFKENVSPSSINKVTDYNFIYNTDTWQQEDGGGSYRTVDMTELGFSITGTPTDGNTIIVTASFADPTYHNNAKWYADALKNVGPGIVSTRVPGRPATVVGHYDSENNSYVFDFGVPTIKPHASATIIPIAADSTPTVEVEVTDAPEQTGTGELAILQKSFDFTFNLPGVHDAGFANAMTTEVTTLNPSNNATAEVEVVDSPDTAKQFNFKFGIPRGATGPTGAAGRDGVNGDKGDAGVGISAISWVNNTNQLIISLTNGSSFVSPSLKGPRGQSGVTTSATSFHIGNVTIDDEPNVEIRVGNNNQVLFDFALPNVITCSDSSNDGDLVISYYAEEVTEAI